MKSLQAGAAPASRAVSQAAEQLLAAYPGPLHILTGLRLVEASTGHWLNLDMVVLTATAVSVGVEARAGMSSTVTPQAAALGVARLQSEQLGQPPLPIYAFWLGAAAPSGYTGGAPALATPEAVQRFVEQASQQAGPPQAQAAEQLARLLLLADVGPVGVRAEPGATTRPAARLAVGRQPARQVWRQRLREAHAWPGQLDARLRERIRQPFPWRRGGPVRPAEVQERLEAAMLAAENVLEDARYLKIVPNVYLVELNPVNYEQHYRLIEQRVCAQWREKLLEALDTANRRQGRRQYQFGGPVQVHVRAGPGLAQDEVRLRCRVVPGAESPAAAAYLELLSTGQRWPIPPGITRLGRSDSAEVRLEDVGRVGDKPLISGQHAHLVLADGKARLCDGSPAGRPSLNGTFLNGRRVSPEGQTLTDGDLIVLAPLNPHDPRADAPGAVALRFHAAGWDESEGR